MTAGMLGLGLVLRRENGGLGLGLSSVASSLALNDVAWP